MIGSPPAYDAGSRKKTMKSWHAKTKLALLMCSIGHVGAGHAGEWIWSPSIMAHSHAVHVDSKQEALKKNEQVYGVDTSIDGRYQGPWVLGSVAWTNTMYRYTVSKEDQLSLNEYAVSMQSGPESEQFQMRLSWDRQRDLFNTIRGSFSDDLFAKDNGFIADDQDVLLRYQNPETWNIDTVMRWLRHHNKTQSDDKKLSHQYRIDTWNASLGQFTGDPVFYWRLDQEWQHTLRNKVQKYQSTNRNAEISVPVGMDRMLRLVATHQYSLYKNPALDSAALGNDDAQYESWGIGASWRSSSRKTNLMLTRDMDVQRKTFYWSGKARYTPNRQSYLEIGSTKKFFGTSSFVSAAYQYKDLVAKLSYDDDVSLQYLLSPINLLTGLYRCPSGAQSLDVLSNCLQIDDLNQPIPEGEIIIPRYETVFPLADRLSLNKDALLSLTYQGLRWSSELTARSNRMLDLEYGLAQDSDELSYALIRGAGRPQEYKFSWKFRTKELFPSEITSHERFYAVSFQHNLNRHAYWQVALQHINQQTSSGQYDYKDNRISLLYTHHFGSKNIHQKQESQI